MKRHAPLKTIFRVMALPVHGACRHDQEEPSSEILYIEPQKKWLAHV